MFKKKHLIGFAAVMLSLLLFNSNLNAQNFGRVAGKVTDAATGDYLPGANVILEGTTIGASSGRYGEFTMEKVPAGKYTLKVGYIGYSDYTTSIEVISGKTLVVDASLSMSAIEMQDVVINGIRQGQVKALNQQMTADNIQNVLSKEEMEKFPDLNTADALQRVPGVNVTKSLGSGRFVYIRGTEPRLTNVTVNGQKIASAEDEERFVGLDAVNTSQLAAIEVVKTLTPDMDADAIGGSVNLITRSAFDYQKSVLKLNAAGGYAVLGSNPLYKTSVTYSTLFGKNNNWGLTLGGSYNANHIVAHSNEFDYNDNNDVLGNTIVNALDDYRMYYYNTKRNTLGVNAALEYKTDAENSYFVRGMYNHIDDIQTRNMIRYRIGKGDYLSSTLISKARLAFEMQDRTESRTLTSIEAGGKNSFGLLKFDYVAAYSYGSEDRRDPAAFKSEWQLDQKVNLQLDLADEDFPGITITNSDIDDQYVRDPAHWEIDNQDYRQVLATNSNFTAAVNLNYPYEFSGNSANFKAGGKISLSTKDRDGSRTKYKWKGSDDIFMSSVAGDETINNFLLDHYVFGPIVDRDKFISFFDANRDKDDALRPYENRDDNDGEGGKFKATEDIFSGYLMTTVNFDNLMVLIGARNEYTTTAYDGKELKYDPNGDYLSSEDASVSNSYNYILPAIHLRYKITPVTNLRLAYTGGIARPNYWNLAPYRWVYAEDREIVEGNPELKPTTSQNIDVMFGHYFQGIGALNIGAFYKSLSDISYEATTQISGGEFDGYALTKSINGGTAKLYGVELSWMQQFTFLPGFFNGFGIYANYTYTKSNADLQYRERNVLPGQAGNVGNIGLNYEKGKFSGRLSANFSDEVLVKVGETEAKDRWDDKRLQVDFTGTYEIMNNFDFYLELVNITNAPQRVFYGINKPRENAYYDMSLRAGLKIDM